MEGTDIGARESGKYRRAPKAATDDARFAKGKRWGKGARFVCWIKERSGETEVCKADVWTVVIVVGGI